VKRSRRLRPSFLCWKNRQVSDIAYEQGEKQLENCGYIGNYYQLLQPNNNLKDSLMWGSKTIRGALGVLLLGFSSMASAEYFIGADATSMKGDIAWGGSSVSFVHDLTPGRIRLGYQGDFFGFEVHAYSKVDDDATDNGFTTNLELDVSYGAYVRMQEKWVYARLGVTWFDTYYTVYDPLNPGVSLITDRDMIAMMTFALGFDIPLTKNLAVNLDYTYADGRAVYPNITASGPGLTDPTLVIKGPGLGVTFKF
jgi:opacity protein-like surface antigen